MHRIFNIRYSSSKLYNTGEFLVGLLSQFLDDAFQLEDTEEVFSMGPLPAGRPEIN